MKHNLIMMLNIKTLSSHLATIAAEKVADTRIMTTDISLVFTVSPPTMTRTIIMNLNIAHATIMGTVVIAKAIIGEVMTDSPTMTMHILTLLIITHHLSAGHFLEIPHGTIANYTVLQRKIMVINIMMTEITDELTFRVIAGREKKEELHIPSVRRVEAKINNVG